MISLFFEKLSLNDCFNTGCCDLKFRNIAAELTDLKRGKKKLILVAGKQYII